MSESYTFLTDPEAERLFGKLDYLLRSGEHIQAEHHDQREIFRFLTRWVPELTRYYEVFFGLSLREVGSVYGNRYYYLEPIEGVKNKIPGSLRQSLKRESVLIGIFLCKLEIDFSNVSTVSGFKRVLREDYEAYKSDFFRLLAHVSGDDYLKTDDQAVDKKIDGAFEEFHRLGWVRLSGDSFETMPSLEHLKTLYVNEINNVDELLHRG